MAPTGQGQCARLLNRPGSIDSGNKILIVFGYNLTKMLRFMLINKHFLMRNISTTTKNFPY